jgi:hypothetical protein
VTPTQLTLLKNNIIENYSNLWNNQQFNQIAENYNVQASPNYYIWRTSISIDEIKKNIAWTEIIALTQGQRDTFRFLTEFGTIDASDANIREAFLAVFAAGTTRDNLILLSKRTTTVAEKLFATGTGSLANPAIASFEGRVTRENVLMAMGS